MSLDKLLRPSKVTVTIHLQFMNKPALISDASISFDFKLSQ